MGGLIKIVLAGLAATAVVLVLASEPAQTTATAENPVRLGAGGAKFVKVTSGTTRTGSAQPRRQMPSGVVDLMAPPASPAPTTGLGLSDLHARQRTEAAGLVTQRNGSASLPRHNDVSRMDGMRRY